MEAARLAAKAVLGFLADQKYQGEEILHAIIACDFVSRSRMEDAIARLICGHDQEVREQARREALEKASRQYDRAECEAMSRGDDPPDPVRWLLDLAAQPAKEPRS